MKPLKITILTFFGLFLLLLASIFMVANKEKKDCLNFKENQNFETYSSTKNGRYDYSEIQKKGFFHKNEKVEILIKPFDLKLSIKNLLTEQKGSLAFFYESGEKSCKILIDTKNLPNEEADVFLNGIPYKINEKKLREEKINPKALFEKIDCRECDGYGPFENIK